MWHCECNIISSMNVAAQCVGIIECCSMNWPWGWCAHLMRSLSTKLLALSLTGLLFTHLSSQLLVLVLLEALVLFLVEDLQGALVHLV